jgi:hypothetical protein
MTSFTPLKSQTLQHCDFAAQIVKGVIVDQDAMSFEESIQLVPRAKTKQPLQLTLRQMAILVFLQRKQFQGAAWQIIAPGAEPRCEIVRNFNGQMYAKPSLLA